MSDYQRIARLIEYLDERQGEQPSLAELAGVVGLSPHHLHRLFSAWASTTPKAFLQCLTAARAKELLREGNSVLDTSLEVGLSGPGRLHDLCVSLEGASPGELKSGGAGWEIVHGLTESPFGSVLIAESPRGICHLSFVGEIDLVAPLKKLKTDWFAAAFRSSNERARELADRIFSPDWENPDRKPLRALLRGTEFQIRVWRALIQIPPGSLVSYGRLAENLVKPNASRAVGSAVGQNDIAFLIPCHRVIRGTGVLGNYRWGRTRKRAILGWENGQRASRYAIS